jgi:hypothetical protein
MRAVDDPMPIYLAILRLLRQWGSLPESDLSSMLRQYMLVTDDYREMEEQGYIAMAFIGDEYVISPSTLGRLLIEQEG